MEDKIMGDLPGDGEGDPSTSEPEYLIKGVVEEPKRSPMRRKDKERSNELATDKKRVKKKKHNRIKYEY
ncbi:MAG: hypothetical protein JSW39_08410 [Desulfobacterales bacterium]|nr:MAG: hypothetical protein JSW39_08410 [Desulfobacterales bacterium]